MIGGDIILGVAAVILYTGGQVFTQTRQRRIRASKPITETPTLDSDTAGLA